MKFELPQELAQEILNYLATRPFQEVFQTIGKLQSLKKIEEVKSVEPKK